MRQPTQSTTAPVERKPGRSFEDPNRPLGDELLARSPTSPPVKEDFRTREQQAVEAGHGVAERAKAIAVLRKAEELMAERNPPAYGDAALRRALELAAGRVGLTIGEYDGLVKGDEELMELERKVIENARNQFR